MKWKNVRLTPDQVRVIEKHASREYNAEGTAEGLRAILYAYFTERGIPFSIQTRKRGRPVGTIKKKM